MDILDIFNDDAFGVTTMSTALQELRYKPTFVSKLGLFESESVDTLSIAIEKQNDNSLIIVPSSPRGGPGATMGSDRRNLRSLNVPHYQIDDAVMADRVQGVRAFGKDRARQSLQTFIAGRGKKARQSFELTGERQKLALITKGQLLDADGSVLYDYYSEMGEAAEATIAFDLKAASPANGALRAKCDAVVESIGESLDGIPYDGIVAICGKNFWNDLIAHKEVYEIFLGWSGAKTLQKSTVSADRASAQAGIWGELDFADIRWVKYRGGQNVNVDPDEAYFVPLGVPELFKTTYAPADYVETVNTPGLELYAKQWRMPNDKGVNLEFQSNVLHHCTRPRVLRKGKKGA